MNNPPLHHSLHYSTESLLQCMTEAILHAVHQPSFKVKQADMDTNSISSSPSASNKRKKRRRSSTHTTSHNCMRVGTSPSIIHEGRRTEEDDDDEEETEEDLPPLLSPFSSLPSYVAVDSSSSSASVSSSAFFSFSSQYMAPHMAPLEVLYGKHLLHALDIVDQQDEAIIRYVEESRAGTLVLPPVPTTASLLSPLAPPAGVAPRREWEEEEEEEDGCGDSGRNLEEEVWPAVQHGPNPSLRCTKGVPPPGCDTVPPHSQCNMRMVSDCSGGRPAAAAATAPHGETVLLQPRSSPCADSRRRSVNHQTAPSPKNSPLAPRCVYRVGDYVLFSPYYCPCSAYAYQCIRQRAFATCKHMLALRLALHGEKMENNSSDHSKAVPEGEAQGEEKEGRGWWNNTSEEEDNKPIVARGGRSSFSTSTSTGSSSGPRRERGKISEKVVPSSVFRKILQVALMHVTLKENF